MAVSIGDGGSNTDGLAPVDVSSVRLGRYTRIRPVQPTDYQWLFETATLTPAGSRWRLHGHVPSIEQFLTGLFERASATFVIEDHERNRMGMTQIWQPDQLSRHAQVTAFLVPEYESSGWPLEGVALCIDFAFQAYDLRKIYFETLTTELVTFKSLVGGLFQEEGCLRGHQYVFGAYHDLHVLALYREDFRELVNRLGPQSPQSGNG